MISGRSPCGCGQKSILFVNTTHRVVFFIGLGWGFPPMAVRRPLNPHRKQYSAKVSRAVFLSSGLSPAISKSSSTTIKSPVSKSFGIRCRRKPLMLLTGGGRCPCVGGGVGGSGGAEGFGGGGVGFGDSSTRLRRWEPSCWGIYRLYISSPA